MLNKMLDNLVMKIVRISFVKVLKYLLVVQAIASYLSFGHKSLVNCQNLLSSTVKL